MLTNISPIHTDVVIQDITTSLKFYCEILGYEVIEDALVEGPVVSFLSNYKSKKMRLVFLGRNKRSTMIELIQFVDNPKDAFEESVKMHRNVSLSFLVPDIQEAMDGFRSQDLKPLTDVFQIQLPKLGTTEICFFQDPSGYLIEIVAAK